ncbi:kinase-like domain-containing protein [Xylaria digitata]|nr:kinase-like domain-containing protein [Xylaria digitata]
MSSWEDESDLFLENAETTISEEEDASQDESHVGFLYGPQDSFNYVLAVPPPPNPQNAANPQTVFHADFISLVTAVSQVYRRDGYLDMRKLDDVVWQEVDIGSVFQVSRSSLDFRVMSPADSKRTHTVVNKLVIKRVKKWSMSESNIVSFNRELRILHHLQGTDNIVRLRGVGWFYNWDTARHIPEPVLMLEEALYSLQYLVSPIVQLSPITMLSESFNVPIVTTSFFLVPVLLLTRAVGKGIFYDITRGLSSLHQCGIVHGDINPKNVLLFPTTRLEEGVEVGVYIAKLSDFSLAVLDNGRRQYLPGGTHPYMAPESQDYLSFPELKLTDVFSPGLAI